jgi:hypothetical protein
MEALKPRSKASLVLRIFPSSASYPAPKYWALGNAFFSNFLASLKATKYKNNVKRRSLHLGVGFLKVAKYKRIEIWNEVVGSQETLGHTSGRWTLFLVTLFLEQLLNRFIYIMYRDMEKQSFLCKEKDCNNQGIYKCIRCQKSICEDHSFSATEHSSFGTRKVQTCAECNEPSIGMRIRNIYCRLITSIVGGTVGYMIGHAIVANISS